MSDSNEGGPVSCATPIDVAILADYWAAALPASEEAAVETHLLECDRCGARLRDVIALAEALRTVAREGRLRMVVSETFLRQAAQDGVRIRQYAPPAGGRVACTVAAEDDILVGRLAADVSGARRIDLSVCNERGIEQIRLPDIPVRAGMREVIYQESSPFIKAAPSFTLRARLLAVDDEGGERLLGEYTFNHTRTLPPDR
ncbi:MAG: hypothetical protein IT177_21125 [Acidobacteria bacterium]|nr:hypothetical protein [Acidobacteriota bacterium]